MSINKKILKFLILKIIGSLLFFSGLYFILNKLFTNKGIYILMYHRIQDKGDDFYYQDIAVKRKEFEKQLSYFTNNYCCITMSEALSILSKNTELDKDYIVFTFDDGYKDNLDYGQYFFRKYHICPVLYLTAGKIDSRLPIWTEIFDEIIANSNSLQLEIAIKDSMIKCHSNSIRKRTEFAEEVKSALKEMPQQYIMNCLNDFAKKYHIDTNKINTTLLSWSDIMELSKSGCELGSHTMNHVNLAAEPMSTVAEELEKSCALIEEKTYYKSVHFAYPFGKPNHYNDLAVKKVQDYYKSAVTTTEGLNKCKDNVYLLRRIMIANHHSLIDIRIKLLRIKILDFLNGNNKHA